MPFVKETQEMNREKFVSEALSKTASFAALCRKYHISRPTGYLWIERHHNGQDFHDKSHAPFHTPHKTTPQIEALIVQTRLKEPAIGAVKIKRMLENKGYTHLPAASTINAILKRNNLITKEASQAATPHKRFEKEAPNIMWQCDFKGHYGLLDGTRCYPLSIIDDHSRFCLCADAKDNERFEGVADSFTKSFLHYGLPDILLCDNGNPWGASQSGGITRFEVWLMELGILTIHIRPRRPQTQGKVERFNGSFKKERLKFSTPENLAHADRERQEYRHFYNYERPHHALGLDTPASRYCASLKGYPDTIKEWEYSSNYEVRKLKSSGYFNYGGQGSFFSEALGGKTIALKPSQTQDGIINLYFRQFRVGQYSLINQSIISRKIYLRENDPRNDIF